MGMDGGDRLSEAAMKGDAAEVRRLLAAGADPGRRSGAAGFTALMLAALNGREECLRLLLPGSDARAADRRGYTALMLAADQGHEACVERLLPVSDAKAPDGRRRPVPETEESRADCVERLQPVSDDAVWVDFGMTALMLAAKNGYARCVELLLPVSDADYKDCMGRTALMLAVVFDRCDCVSRLLPCSDASVRDHSGRTALMIAAAYGHEECVERLLPHSDVLGAEGRMVAALALEHGHASAAVAIEGYARSVEERSSLEAWLPKVSGKPRTEGRVF